MKLLRNAFFETNCDDVAAIKTSAKGLCAAVSIELNFRECIKITLHWKYLGIITAMNSAKRPFFKALPNFGAATDELEANEAAESIYRWWWECLRLSPVLWFAAETGFTPREAAVAKVAEAFGDLRSGNFKKWWRETGAKVFAESKRPSRVTLLDLSQLNRHRFDTNKIYIEVPLTIRRQTIAKQFKRILADAHEGRALDLVKHSNAEFKLHTKRYQLNTVKNEYWVLLYRLLHPRIEIWRIGDRLQVAPQHRMRDALGLIADLPKAPMNSLTGRYLYKARFALLNAERGSFPNYTAVQLSERYQPFGLKHQTEFRHATEDGKDGSESAWKNWLRRRYAADLRNEVARRNHVGSQLDIDGLVRRRIDAFIAGTSDLLK